MRKILFMALAVLIAAGCAESEKGTLCVKIAPAIRTRVTGLHFDTGDRIGLTISKGSGPVRRERADDLRRHGFYGVRAVVVQ